MPLLGLTRARELTMALAYYFGCVGDEGHYLWDAGLTKQRIKVIYEGQPWGVEIDSGLCPKGSSGPEGIARLHQRDGWTAIAFWDRSEDSRPGSNSVFLFQELLTFDEALARARATFQTIFARFTFEVRL